MYSFLCFNSTFIRFFWFCYVFGHLPFGIYLYVYLFLFFVFILHSSNCFVLYSVTCHLINYYFTNMYLLLFSFSFYIYQIVLFFVIYSISGHLINYYFMHINTHFYLFLLVCQIFTFEFSCFFSSSGFRFFINAIIFPSSCLNSHKKLL